MSTVFRSTQPRTLRDGSSDELIKELAPDIIVVVAYGCIIPPQLLHAAKYGCINLHVSLLPKYRGSAPIQWAVLNGDEGTGVTIMQLDEGLDTGDILMVEPVTIDPEETSGELFDRVSAVGAGTLVTALEKIEAGELTPRKQDNAAATMAPPLTKDMAQFDFTQDAAHIHNWVRGMNPWPMAWFVTAGGKKVKVTECRVAASNGEAPGTVLSTKPLTVACADGAVQLLHVVPEAKSRWMAPPLRLVCASKRGIPSDGGQSAGSGSGCTGPAGAGRLLKPCAGCRTPPPETGGPG